MLERINLVPQLPLAERIRKLILPVTAILLILVLIFLGAGDLMLKAKNNALSRDIAQARQRAEEITVAQARVGMLSGNIKRQKEEKERLTAEVAKLTGIQEKKNHYSLVLAAITSAMPTSINCEKITFQKDGGQISGTARQYRELPAFVKNLGSSPLFSGVILNDLDKNPDTKKSDFSFTIFFQLKREGETT